MILDMAKKRSKYPGAAFLPMPPRRTVPTVIWPWLVLAAATFILVFI